MSASLGSKVVSQEMVVGRLITDATLVGGIFTMGFEECLVLTNDLWKQKAHGIPQHCFLLATVMQPDSVPDPDDEEVILLRVLGPASLSAESELVQVREEAMREMLTARGETGSATPQAILDVLTRNEIQFSGIKAKIVGTFYDATVGGRRVLRFGAGVETFYSSSRYKVYKPHGASLALIASYPQVTDAEIEGDREPVRVRIGRVRYTATQRRERAGGVDNDISVNVNVEDFVGHKTAVFGMSRLGKSNTMKIIASAVAEHAANNDLTIGQLLFDPAGEYANVNKQDETALSRIGAEFVTVFRYGATELEGVRSLATNMFNDDAIQLTWDVVRSQLRDRAADYVKSFLEANVVGPADRADDESLWRRARQRRSLFYATLVKAGFATPAAFRSEFGCNKDVLAQVNAKVDAGEPSFSSDPNGNVKLTGQDIVRFWEAAAKAHKTRDGNPAKTKLEDWFDQQLVAILDVFTASKGSGYRVLAPIRRFHNPDRDEDYVTEILAELRAGKIVVIDLSRGGDIVVQHSSERIVNHILDAAATRFAAGEDPDLIQIYIEEAHTLFSRDKANTPSDRDPYVRLAKEAAKFKLGLIYATQEVTSVDPRILANTANWIITHLNNRAEVKELSKYYEFQDYAEMTINAEEVGFARLRTLSGRYIVPVQIEKFTEKSVQRAREACVAASGRRINVNGQKR